MIDKEKERQNLVTSIGRPTTVLSLNLQNGLVEMLFHSQALTFIVYAYVLFSDMNVGKFPTSSTDSKEPKQIELDNYELAPSSETLSCNLLSEENQEVKDQFKLDNESISKNEGKIGDIYRQLHSTASNKLTKPAKVVRNTKRNKSNVQYEESNILFDFE